MMDDQAHTLACKTRSTEELQSIALNRVLGRVPCIKQPLYVKDLSIAEIRQELRARGVADVDRLREGLQPLLQDMLKGVQQVLHCYFINQTKNSAISICNTIAYYIASPCMT